MAHQTIEDQLDLYDEKMWALRVKYNQWTPKEAEQQKFLAILSKAPPTGSRLLDAVNAIRNQKNGV